jgi:hypothetical protein
MQFNTIARRLVVALCAFSLIGIAGYSPIAAHASAASKALSAEIKASPKYSGKVVSVDTVNGKITIHDKTTGDMTFAITSTTRIKVDKVKATLADITKGMHATIHSADKLTALEINARDKNAPALGTPAPAATPSS